LRFFGVFLAELKMRGKRTTCVCLLEAAIVGIAAFLYVKAVIFHVRFARAFFNDDKKCEPQLRLSMPNA
jgi:hypothetical protein